MTDQLRFIASILSIFTHELNNHTSIMNESAGLVLDLIEIKGGSGDCGLEQISAVTGGITSQIKKTTSIVKYLNRFAHRMDTPISNYSINEVIEELVMLISRVSDQKEIEIDLDLIKEDIVIYGNPSILQYIIFSIIQGYFNNLGGGSKIKIKTLLKDNVVEINFKCIGVKKIKSETIEKLWDYTESVRQIGASIVANVDDKEYTLILPLKVKII